MKSSILTPAITNNVSISTEQPTMFKHDDLGATLYKTWSKKERHDEIARLVEGYRNGLPIGILCKMSEVIAGSRKTARKILQELLSPEERQAAITREKGGILELVQEFLK